MSQQGECGGTKLPTPWWPGSRERGKRGRASDWRKREVEERGKVREVIREEEAGRGRRERETESERDT